MTKKINQTIKIQFLLILIQLILFIFRIDHFPSQIPLFYSKPEGDEQIVDSFMIFILPLTSFIIVIINKLIFIKYFSNNYFIETIIYYVDLLVILLTSFIFLRILFLVT